LIVQFDVVVVVVIDVVVVVVIDVVVVVPENGEKKCIFFTLAHLFEIGVHIENKRNCFIIINFVSKICQRKRNCNE
jgi:hypothetical protein